MMKTIAVALMLASTAAFAAPALPAATPAAPVAAPAAAVKAAPAAKAKKVRLPCGGKKGGIASCEGTKFKCKDGTVSSSKKICDPKTLLPVAK